MLDLFSIFSKGGIVLWCFQGTTDLFTPSVNALIKSVILQERVVGNTFNHGNLTLQYRLDNEFELIFVVAYQKILQLSYVDKFLDDIQLEFRDRYKNDLHNGNIYQPLSFMDSFDRVLRGSESWAKQKDMAPRTMRSFVASEKSKKTVASMIENPKDSNKTAEKGKEKPKKEVHFDKIPVNGEADIMKVSPKMNGKQSLDPDMEMIERNRQKLMGKQLKPGSKKIDKKSPQQKPREKEARKWDNGGTNKDANTLDFSKKVEEGGGGDTGDNLTTTESQSWVGTMHGALPDIDTESDTEDEEIEETEQVDVSKAKGKSSSRFGMFNMFKNLVGSKAVTREDMESVLEKLREHMIAKNVAAEVAEKLCESVATKLEGRVLGTFSGVASTVRQTLTESLVQLLIPKRRIDILRDAMEAHRNRCPYVITFCGVNGVGKSTNLAKIAFWLIENGLRVLIAACDTFRAGAVEQLRTHTRHLNALHPAERHGGAQMVQLYEKGYGKDAAGIAMEAINYARDTHVDVVLVDTAGRMQDNEPLMRALAKLIKVNQPDLVLFVGEALVGNEAVDQLVKFNQALADHSAQDNPHLIDGIVLSKFDTIDDKVGAAVSMTYITGQPIVFVGTGQTYTDLKNLNAKAVVHALMK